MDKIQRFEDLIAWQKARRLTAQVYEASNTCPAFARDFSLKDQVRRAGVSVMSNIAEGFERGGEREFARFLAIARGSSGELRSQLYLALDAGYLTPDAFNHLLGQAEEVSRVIGGLHAAVVSKRDQDRC